MPKASSSTDKSPNHLRRNQACHQCRKRKLKCDAKKPCTCCRRSHANVIAALAMKGEPFSAMPECTYDEPSTEPAPPPTIYYPPGYKHKDGSTHSSSPEVSSGQGASPAPPSAHVEDDLDASSKQSHNSITLKEFPSSATASTSNTGSIVSTPASSRPSSSSLTVEPLARRASLSPNAPLTSFLTFNSGPDGFYNNPPSSQSFSLPSISTYPEDTNSSRTLELHNWPPYLPPPELLVHLVETLFACNPLCARLLHRPTFMTCIHLNTNDPRFPSVALLHAICALASLHSSDLAHQYQKRTSKPLPRPPRPEMNPFSYGEEPTRQDSFAEDQAAMARAMMQMDVGLGRRMLESVQCTVILGWYYYATAHWVDAWTMSGLAIRHAIPIGIHRPGTFDNTLVDSWRDRAITANPKSPAELEQRRNTFWLAYLIDAHQSVSTGWPGNIEEIDVGQTLPGTLQDYEQSVDLSHLLRQSIHSPNVWIHHPPEFTDGFTLHVKAAILLARVARFNSRLPSVESWRLGESMGPDIRSGLSDVAKSQAFIDLEETIHAFRSSFPSEFRDYMKPRNAKAGLDPNLYVAHIIPAAALILLHDPQVDKSILNCLSAQKTLQAAQFIISTIYALTATSYDLTLLIHTTALYWAKAAGVFTRYYGQALQMGRVEEALTYKDEANAIISALMRIGERVPVAASLSKIVKDWLHAAFAMAANMNPAPDQVWSYLRYSERSGSLFSPAYLGDSHTE